MRIFLLLLVLVFIGCSTNSAKYNKDINERKEKLVKRINGLKTLSNENRDSLIFYVHKIEEGYIESSTVEFENFLNIVNGEKNYGTSRGELDDIINKGTLKYREKIDNIIVARVAMKRFCTEEEWKIINSKKQKKRDK